MSVWGGGDGGEGGGGEKREMKKRGNYRILRIKFGDDHLTPRFFSININVYPYISDAIRLPGR